MNMSDYELYAPWRRDPAVSTTVPFEYAGWKMLALLDAAGNLLHVVPAANHPQLRERHVRDATNVYRDGLRD